MGDGSLCNPLSSHIANLDFSLHRRALRHMQFARRVASQIENSFVVEAGGLEDKSVTFAVAGQCAYH